MLYFIVVRDSGVLECALQHVSVHIFVSICSTRYCCIAFFRCHVQQKAWLAHTLTHKRKCASGWDLVIASHLSMSTFKSKYHQRQRHHHHRRLKYGGKDADISIYHLRIGPSASSPTLSNAFTCAHGGVWELYNLFFNFAHKSSSYVCCRFVLGRTLFFVLSPGLFYCN